MFTNFHLSRLLIHFWRPSRIPLGKGATPEVTIESPSASEHPLSAIMHAYKLTKREGTALEIHFPCNLVNVADICWKLYCRRSILDLTLQSREVCRRLQLLPPFPNRPQLPSEGKRFDEHTFGMFLSLQSTVGRGEVLERWKTRGC